jgi:hypothetical protein
MATQSRILAAILVLLASASAIQGQTPAPVASTPANRIVGLWQTTGEVGPCTGGPATVQVRNYLLFNVGGTVVENISPSTVRNTGLGTWTYDPVSKAHGLFLQFDRFANGVYVGYSTIERELVMSPDGLELTGRVVATAYAPDGSVLLELCGEPTSTRVR